MPGLVFAEIAIAIALTAAEIGISALVGGQSNYGQRTLNRAYSSSTYGTDIARCRGTVRLPGGLIWATVIWETVRKSV